VGQRTTVKNIKKWLKSQVYNYNFALFTFLASFAKITHMIKGILYIVATPIGNLSDITARAIETLRGVDLILCEDTRVTRNLLEHFQIKVPTESYHHHSAQQKVRQIITWLNEGKSLALVSDAGTPGISDPGNELIDQVLKNKELGEVIIVPIPGACAAISALSISGFKTDKFVFLGFPPHKNKRQKFFTTVAESEHTTVFYESGHRIKKCLLELEQVLALKRQLVVCRELTKKFETIYRGTAAELVLKVLDERGEFVVVVSC
jgi:16S rRNA (cytidine1402-2'-O)-methyltransferase